MSLLPPLPPGQHGEPSTRARAARRALRDAASWSRLVGFWKVALPTLAGLLILVMGIWPLAVERGDHGAALDGPGQLDMTEARYVGVDKNRHPFELRAERAQQIGRQGDVQLVRPQADMSLSSGRWLTVSAREGSYDQGTGRLTLTGHVTLFHDSGYEFVTETAQLDSTHGVAWGDSRITGQGPMGDIDAGGFRVLDEGRTLVFTGKARLRLVTGVGTAEATP